MQGVPTHPTPRSALEARSPPHQGTGPMGGASGGCQGHGETGAGAGAAVATGKRVGRRGWGRDGVVQGRGWLEQTV